jgi:hypothetical protein
MLKVEGRMLKVEGRMMRVEGRRLKVGASLAGALFPLSLSSPFPLIGGRTNPAPTRDLWFVLDVVLFGQTRRSAPTKQ